MSSGGAGTGWGHRVNVGVKKKAVKIHSRSSLGGPEIHPEPKLLMLAWLRGFKARQVKLHLSPWYELPSFHP